MFSQFLQPIVICLIGMFQKKSYKKRRFKSELSLKNGFKSTCLQFFIAQKNQSFTTLFLKRIQYLLHSTSLMKILLTINNSPGQLHACTKDVLSFKLLAHE